jgi:hypothetical protein
LLGFGASARTAATLGVDPPALGTAVLAAPAFVRLCHALSLRDAPLDQVSLRIESLNRQIGRETLQGGGWHEADDFGRDRARAVLGGKLGGAGDDQAQGNRNWVVDVRGNL